MMPQTSEWLDQRAVFSSEPETAESPSRLKLSRPELDSIVGEIKKIQFSSYLEDWIRIYQAVGQRGRFLWQWCLKGVRMTTLPCVPAALREDVVETKMLSIFFGTLIDDIADREQDRELLQMAVSAASEDWPLARLELWSGRRRSCLELIYGLWNSLWARCKTYTRFKEFELLLKFDNDQILNSMRYALLANQSPGLLNVIEHDLYQPNNMQIMFMATVDLSASPEFDLDELGLAREVFWHAQRMGRIGNMITTWEREVLDRDFSSGVFAYAIGEGLISAGDLRELPAHEIMGTLENAKCQHHFLSEWEHHRAQMEQKLARVRSVDLLPYLRAFEDLLKLHLCSRGLM
jgi:hypothetical protein